MRVRELITELEATGKPEYEVVAGDSEGIYALLYPLRVDDEEREVVVGVERTVSTVSLNPDDSFTPGVKRVDS